MVTVLCTLTSYFSMTSILDLSSKKRIERLQITITGSLSNIIIFQSKIDIGVFSLCMWSVTGQIWICNINHKKILIELVSILS